MNGQEHPEEQTRRAVHSSPAARRLLRRRYAGELLQVHPVPRSRDGILAVVLHLIGRCAAAQGKVPPGCSEEAAALLASRSWNAGDLARRIAHVIATNRGSLITAGDLLDP
jgi:hypothetical protein